MASPLPQPPEGDTLQHQEWLLTDTLDLRLAGPSFEVSFFKDDIIFLSTSHEGMSRVAMDHPLLANSEPLFSNDPFPYSPAGVSFSSDQTGCYLTSYVKLAGEFSLEKIFMLSLEKNLSSGLRQIAPAGDTCRYLHPALSPNDSLMVFSSDRLPTSGGLDLFVSRLSADGWSQAVNLGPSINTHGHERYPFLDQENNLWFSSTGHSGYGSYDIFICPFDGKTWEQAQNLGKSINTPKDEIGFSIHPSGQVFLFTRKSMSEGMAFRTVHKQSADYSIAMILQNLADPPSDPVAKVTPAPEPEAAVQADTLLEKTMPAGEDVPSDPQSLVFRVQILSNPNANSTTSVDIEGNSFQTFEYYYKGAYRITVGEFETVQAANQFRLQCRRAGFNQAFVAAFRGGERETDPSVFKN